MSAASAGVRVLLGLAGWTVLGCGATTRLAREAETVTRTCPTAHEVAELRPVTVGVLQGTVQAQAGDDLDGLPGAMIRLSVPGRDDAGGYQASSGSDGSYSLTGVPRGDYVLTVCKAGFVTLRGPVAIRPGVASRPVTLTTRPDW